MSDKLLPCPFCGSKKVNIMTRLQEIKSFDGYCLDCDCSGPQFLTKKGAITAWNRRSSPRLETVALRLDADPHQWSKRPCATCAAISKDIGKDFGCIAFYKSPLSYTEYGRAALAALDREEKP